MEDAAGIGPVASFFLQFHLNYYIKYVYILHYFNNFSTTIDYNIHIWYNSGNRFGKYIGYVKCLIRKSLPLKLYVQ